MSYTPVTREVDTEPKIMDVSEIVKRQQSHHGKIESLKTDVKELTKRLNIIEAQLSIKTNAVSTQEIA